MTNLDIKLYADTSDITTLETLYKQKVLDGATTNPTLMKQAGISEYENAAKKIISALPDLPLSFEVFSDDFDEMEAQGRLIGSWAKNVYVKVPIINTKGEVSKQLIRNLSQDGFNLNITAVFGTEYIEQVLEDIHPESNTIISVFAGRIADIGIDPLPIVREHRRLIDESGCKADLLWASTREVYNIYEAQNSGCDIITMPPGIFKKLSAVGKTIDEITRSCVQVFYDDAKASGFSLETSTVNR